MKRNELLEFYRKTCRGFRQDPEEAEFEIWTIVLGSCEPNDLSVALKTWLTSENGKFPPKPCQLKPIAEANARIRRKLETPEFCENSGLGMVVKLSGNEMNKVRCECPECARAWEWRDNARKQ